MSSAVAAAAALPWIMYGTAWKKSRTKALVLAALRAGFRGIDTANQLKHYNEQGVGDAIKESGIPRKELFLQTKFTSIDGQDRSGPVPYDPRQPLATQVRQSFDSSCEHLGTRYIDSLVMHSPMRTHDGTMQVWREFEKLVDEGKVRFLGISNVDLAQLKRLTAEARVKPSFVQNRFYADTKYDGKLRKFCKKHDINYQSFWTLTANPHILEAPALVAAARKARCSPEAAWFSYLAFSEEIMLLTGTTSRAHMTADLEAVRKPLLDDASTAAIAQLLQSQL